MFDQPYIVIFGAAVREDGTPSGALRDRVGAAARFGRRVLPQPIYVVTGAQGRLRAARGRGDGRPAGAARRPSRAASSWSRPAGTRCARCIAVARLLRGAKGPVYAATSAYHMPRCVLLLGLAGLDAHRSPPPVGPASSRLLRRWWWRLREVPAVPVDAAVLFWFRLTRQI